MRGATFGDDYIPLVTPKLESAHCRGRDRARRPRPSRRVPPRFERLLSESVGHQSNTGTEETCPLCDIADMTSEIDVPTNNHSSGSQHVQAANRADKEAGDDLRSIDLSIPKLLEPRIPSAEAVEGGESIPSPRSSLMSRLSAQTDVATCQVSSSSSKVVCPLSAPSPSKVTARLAIHVSTDLQAPGLEVIDTAKVIPRRGSHKLPMVPQDPYQNCQSLGLLGSSELTQNAKAFEDRDFSNIQPFNDKDPNEREANPYTIQTQMLQTDNGIKGIKNHPYMTLRLC